MAGALEPPVPAGVLARESNCTCPGSIKIPTPIPTLREAIDTLMAQLWRGNRAAGEREQPTQTYAPEPTCV